MPRNFGDERGRQIRDPAGFNEAAADAAEFSRASLSFRVVIDSASMRPRQMPRNFWKRRGLIGADELASMRPRQMPRNFSSSERRNRARPIASMRPRQMPRNFHRCARDDHAWDFRFNEAAADAAEFWRSSRWTCRSSLCFNEAAADAAEFCNFAAALQLRRLASMRPRQMPRNFPPHPALSQGN